MAENSGISWTHHTFNPWIGCTKVSPGCDNCYAETLATSRLGVKWGPGAERRRTAPSTWKMPRRWNNKARREGTRYRVFCSSLADVMDNAVAHELRADLATLILATPYLDWLLLTKRIGNAESMLAAMFPDGVPANVVLGITVVNQDEVDRDVPKLLKVRERLEIRRIFLSIEPMLGPITFRGPDRVLRFPGGITKPWLAFVTWMIVGGESGSKARPISPAWPRRLRDEAAACGTIFHFKQWGEFRPVHWSERTQPGDHRFDDGISVVRRVGVKAAGRLLDDVEHNGVI